MNNPTICAIATAPGGAIGIIRISGSEALTIADRIFRPVGSNAPLADRKPYTLAFGNIVNAENEVVDEVLVSIFHAPHSYTGENSVEISCHGSAYILQQVMFLLTQNGCIPAGPGEFTQRAFLNGKMDLSQAEAVADLISATNKATHDMALSQLKGHFSNELSDLRAHLLKLTSLLELELDFSDHEELEFADRSELYTLACDIHQRLASLARSFEVGNALKNGIPVAIVGKTNVGKSTLLNHLLHEEKAIVSDVHGTTRDFIEDTTIINGIQFRFVDTAGIRTTDDVVENIGIERTYQKLQEAKIVLWLIDQQPTEAEIEDIKERVADKKLIIVRNKIDKSTAHSTFNIQHSTFLHEPNASIMKAGCFDELAAAYGVSPVSRNSHLFLSDEPVEDFPGRSFVVERVTTMNKGELRKALVGIEKANIATRNFPLTVAELRKRLKIKDGGDVYIFATTTAEGEHLLLISRKYR